VANPPRASYLCRKVGAKLRMLREQAGHTLTSAAPLLDKTRSALHRVETGETKPNVHLVKSMMDIYDQYDPHLLDEVRRALKPPWYRAIGVKGPGAYLGVETEATAKSEFSAQLVPGLVQTERYMRALFTAHSTDERRITRSIAIRLARQRRLTSADDPLNCVFVIDEAALLRQVGGPDVMREQLRRLIEVSALPTVTLHVLPLSHGAHYAMPGAFDLLAFLNPADPEYLFIEHFNGGLHIEDRDPVRKAKLGFRQLRSASLSPADSVALIEGLLTAPSCTTRLGTLIDS
jgi:DNA-binding XRE family transcriptional regulator